MTEPNSTQSPPRLITKAELLRRVPYSFAKVWQMMVAGEFPKSRLTGGKATWLESEVNDWIASRPPKEYGKSTPPQQTKKA